MVLTIPLPSPSFGRAPVKSEIPLYYHKYFSSTHIYIYLSNKYRQSRKKSFAPGRKAQGLRKELLTASAYAITYFITEK